MNEQLKKIADVDLLGGKSFFDIEEPKKPKKKKVEEETEEEDEEELDDEGFLDLTKIGKEE